MIFDPARHAGKHGLRLLLGGMRVAQPSISLSSALAILICLLW